jgi:hypothetical protein
VIGVLLAAGLIARWITQWDRPGVLAPGDRLGIIHFLTNPDNGAQHPARDRQDSLDKCVRTSARGNSTRSTPMAPPQP